MRWLLQRSSGEPSISLWLGCAEQAHELKRVVMRHPVVCIAKQNAIVGIVPVLAKLARD